MDAFSSSNPDLACTLTYLFTPYVMPTQPFVRPMMKKVPDLMQAAF